MDKNLRKTTLSAIRWKMLIVTGIRIAEERDWNKLKISLVIPTLNAGKYIEPLLKRIKEQTIPVGEIVIVDSSSDDDTVIKAQKFDDVKVISIERKDFNHGGTRDLAIQQTTGDIILCLTQDALPCDEYYVEHLTSPFAEDEKIAMASGRLLCSISPKCLRSNRRLWQTYSRQWRYENCCSIHLCRL